MASGRDVMDGIAGSRVTADLLISGFAHEPDLAHAPARPARQAAPADPR